MKRTNDNADIEYLKRSRPLSVDEVLAVIRGDEVVIGDVISTERCIYTKTLHDAFKTHGGTKKTSKGGLHVLCSLPFKEGGEM